MNGFLKQTKAVLDPYNGTYLNVQTLKYLNIQIFENLNIWIAKNLRAVYMCRDKKEVYGKRKKGIYICGRRFDNSRQ